MKRNILTALLSLLAAIALWVYVITVVGPEDQQTFRDIPVAFQGASALEEKGLMLLTEETPTVTLELSGNRMDLNKLSASNITVTVDLAKIYDPGKNAFSYNISYPGNVANDVITVQSRVPTGITLDVVRRAYKDVPVEVDFSGSLSAEYMKETPELEMETVRISGPEDVMEKIDSARIQIELIEDTKTTITGEFTYTLCDKDKNPVDAKWIQVTSEGAETIGVIVPIKRVKEIPLTVKVVEGGGATADNSSIVIDPLSIHVSGDEELLANLEELEIGTVDLSNMLEDQELTFPITLPEGIVNETGITEATVKVSFPNLLLQSFTATKFNAINVPEGMTATISAKELEVTIRGSRDVVESLTTEDITVTVDCAAAEQGNQKLNAIITIKGNPTGIGAVGTYTILVQLEQTPEPTEA